MWQKFLSNFQNPEAWFYGLVATFWSAIIDVLALGLGSVTVTYVNPKIPLIDWRLWLTLALYNGIKSAVFYLKQCPLKLAKCDTPPQITMAQAPQQKD